MIEVTPELLAKHDQPGPRYTSYPTALEFTEDFGRTEYTEHLDEAARHPDEPLSLYVHLPFCQARCSFCACHVVVSKQQSLSDGYLERVLSEANLVADRLGNRRQLAQYHWGGGTPTYYPEQVLAQLHSELMKRFELMPEAEVGIEVDPRVTSHSQMETLSGLGFNRVSLGVQDLDPGVQDLIGRGQTREQTLSLYRSARQIGFTSVNLDLVYGLPGQNEDTVGATLEQIISMRPDRLAVYSFAYVPWMRPHQKRIDPDLLPDTDAKFALLAMIVRELVAAGYHQIGMDHFALAGDELAVAAADGTLSRNFMGYTTKKGIEVVALGVSGISDLAGAYAQNHRRLASYLQDVGNGLLPIERGYRMTAEDRLRRHVITELMCNGLVDLAEAAAMHPGADTPAFDREIEMLTGAGGLVEEGMAIVEDNRIRATELGMLFVRRLARVFDTHTDRRRDDQPRFSRTV